MTDAESNRSVGDPEGSAPGSTPQAGGRPAKHPEARPSASALGPHGIEPATLAQVLAGSPGVDSGALQGSSASEVQPALEAMPPRPPTDAGPTGSPGIVPDVGGASTGGVREMLVRTMAVSSAELWQELLDRLDRVQRSQTELARAIDELGRLVRQAMGTASTSQEAITAPPPAELTAPASAQRSAGEPSRPAPPLHPTTADVRPGTGAAVVDTLLGAPLGGDRPASSGAVAPGAPKAGTPPGLAEGAPAEVPEPLFYVPPLMEDTATSGSAEPAAPAPAGGPSSPGRPFDASGAGRSQPQPGAPLAPPLPGGPLPPPPQPSGSPPAPRADERFPAPLDAPTPPQEGPLAFPPGAPLPPHREPRTTTVGALPPDGALAGTEPGRQADKPMTSALEHVSQELPPEVVDAFLVQEFGPFAVAASARSGQAGVVSEAPAMPGGGVGAVPSLLAQEGGNGEAGPSGPPTEPFASSTTMMGDAIAAGQGAIAAGQAVSSDLIDRILSAEFGGHASAGSTVGTVGQSTQGLPGPLPTALAPHGFAGSPSVGSSPGAGFGIEPGMPLAPPPAPAPAVPQGFSPDAHALVGPPGRGLAPGAPATHEAPEAAAPPGPTEPTTSSMAQPAAGSWHGDLAAQAALVSEVLAAAPIATPEAEGPQTEPPLAEDLSVAARRGRHPRLRPWHH
jgi:hypothetical protein